MRFKYKCPECGQQSSHHTDDADPLPTPGGYAIDYLAKCWSNHLESGCEQTVVLRVSVPVADVEVFSLSPRQSPVVTD